MFNQLLVQCASLKFDEAQADRLVEATSAPLDWSPIQNEAESQALAPLLYKHLNQANISLPRSTKRALQALYLRHRHANLTRQQTLLEIIAAFQKEQIQVLLLKGIALAHLVYPEPALRPMRDMDLLVKRSDARRAQKILQELGFQAPISSSKPLPSKHLTVATRSVEGLLISVEIHHNLFEDDFPDSLTMDELTVPPLSFDLAGITIETLGYEDMLWHLCRHAVYIFQPLRLIWVADIVSFAEKFANEIDWEHIKHHYPKIPAILTQLHYLTPLSENLIKQAQLTIPSNTPKGVGVEFQGWPRYAWSDQQVEGIKQRLAHSLFPSEWWLLLNYGITAKWLPWYRWFGHPIHITGWAIHLLLTRASLKKPLAKVLALKRKLS